MSTAKPHQTQLIVYPDSLSGDLSGLNRTLAGPLGQAVPGGVHLLPPFPSSGDRGFAPLCYDAIEPEFGGWDDVERLASLGPLVVDVMVNHVSRHSTYFQSFLDGGRTSTWGPCFITLDKVFPDGAPTEADVAAIFLRKPEHPFLTVATGGGEERIWASFGPRADHAEQIDLDINCPDTWTLYDEWFAELAAHGVKQIRLDAVGYLTKAPGTACFMNEPTIWPILEDLENLADKRGLAVLPEIHAGSAMHRQLAEQGYLSYDFVLPGLVLHALETGSVTKLRHHLQRSPERQVTMLDCHDGIPMHPDLDEVLSADEIGVVVDACVSRGANINQVLQRAGDDGPPKAHQINCTYRSATGSDDAFLAARAIQLFAPGTPQVYYVGLLAGLNVPRAEGGDGREVNRHNYTDAEIDEALDRDVVRQQLALIEHRNTHPAFQGTLTVPDWEGDNLTMIWRHEDQWSRLDVDLIRRELALSYTTASGTAKTTGVDGLLWPGLT